ncbi:MAG: NAD-binding protein [Oscillospiraceae bacterium]|nr:NAD-binding protein [Oscillospiraceae bacterium]
MRVIIVGAGKVGYYLAKTLMEHGHSPYIIEKDKQRCTHVANTLDVVVFHGDGSTMEMLEMAQADHAEAIVSVTGLDQDNLIACQLAKQVFNVPKTVARVNNPKNAQIMKKLGVDIPVSTTDSISHLLEREIDTSAMKQLLSLNRGEAAVYEIEVPKNYKMSGIRLMELRLPEESVIASITRDGQLIIPRGNTQIIGGDKLLIIAADKVIFDLKHKLEIE